MLSRSTAGSFVAEPCDHSIKDGPNSLLVSSVAEAQADTPEETVILGRLEEVDAEEEGVIRRSDSEGASDARISLASAEAYLGLARGDVVGARENSETLPAGMFAFTGATSDSWRARQFATTSASGASSQQRPRVAANGAAAEANMTVQQLKCKLKERGLGVTGNKAALLERLLAHL